MQLRFIMRFNSNSAHLGVSTPRSSVSGCIQLSADNLGVYRDYVGVNKGNVVVYSFAII